MAEYLYPPATTLHSRYSSVYMYVFEGRTALIALGLVMIKLCTVIGQNDAKVNGQGHRVFSALCKLGRGLLIEGEPRAVRLQWNLDFQNPLLQWNF